MPSPVSGPRYDPPAAAPRGSRRAEARALDRTPETAAGTPLSGAGAAADGASARPRGASMRTAVVANLVGRAWPIALGFVAVPVYLSHLGVEAYALVAAFGVLQAICSVLDMGLGTTLTRQLARAMPGADGAAQSRNLVRSLELPYWAAAAALAVAAVVLAGPAATRWLRPETVSLDTIRGAAVLMGLTVAAQLPFTLYQGGLLGLGRQVLLNGLVVAAATVRVGATLYVLEFVSPTIEAFFLVQLVVSAVQTLAAWAILWASLPKAAGAARFDGALLRNNLAFAAGVAGITAVSLALTQVDKVVLSRVLPLADFGYYGLAATVAGALAAIAQPVFTAVFPRLSQIVASGDESAEAAEYHRASQVLSVLLLPVAIVLAWRSHDVLLAWTGKSDVADHAFLAATLLVAGSALNGVMHVPYALMLAHGWTRLPLVTNVVAVIVLVPALIWASVTYGAVGAAAVWFVLNAGYLAAVVPVLHTRHLRAQLVRWYVHGLALPFAGGLVAAVAAEFAIPAATSRALTIARIGALVAVSVLGAAVLAPEVRRPWLARLRRLAGR
jgi:O-antigen/teichoic acid export membrane protein